jgi:transposase InsO family protein
MQLLDEQRLAAVGRVHDDFRMQYTTRQTAVNDFREFEAVIGRYYALHFAACVAPGARLAPDDAAEMAKEALEREYRRRHGDIVSAFNDAQFGTNDGLRGILDLLCNTLKSQGIERYVRKVFDRMVAPNSWADKVELVRQFIEKYGFMLGSAINADEPERYAHDYTDLIHQFVEGLHRISPTFRRL